VKRSQRINLLLLLALVVLGIALAATKPNCPPQGFALSREQRAIHVLKNRTALPRESDFDANVSLSRMLLPGEDTTRWSSSSAARIQGYVVDITPGGIELANCYSPWRRDTHINLALRPDAPAREQVVVEISATMREVAERQGQDWSEATLRRDLKGHWCSFEGWMFFDSGHARESENTAPGRSDNWRATAWELHPITHFEITSRPSSVAEPLVY